MINTKILGAGIVLLVTGAVAVGAYFFKFTANPQVHTIGVFSGGVGFILMMFGLFSLMSAGFGRKKGIHADDVNAFSVGLFRCMVAISIADNHLDDTEVSEIAKIYKHLTKTDIGEDVIRDTAAQMVENGTTIQDEMRTVTGTLNKELKEKIIIAALYILAADGEMDEGELIMLEDIRQGLNLSARYVEGVKTRFFEKRNLV